MSNQRAPAGQHQKKITPTAPWGPAAGDMQLADQHDQVGRIIRATNVHNQASNGDLATFFNEFEVIDVKRSYMSRVDKSKASPIAWLLLSSPEEARTAKYRLHDVPLHGRPVRIELAEALRGTNVLIPRVHRDKFVVDPAHAGTFIPWEQQPRDMRHRKNNSTSTTSYHIRRMSRNQNEVANTPPVAGHRRRSSQKVTPAPAGRVRRFSQQATPAPAGHGQRFSQQASSAQPKQQSRQQGTAAVSGHNRAFSQQLTPSATAFVPQSLLQDTPPAGSSQEPTQQTSPEASSDTRATRWSWSGKTPILSEETWFNFDKWLVDQGHRRSRVYDAKNDDES